jgi:hypothetical protein
MADHDIAGRSTATKTKKLIIHTWRPEYYWGHASLQSRWSLTAWHCSVQREESCGHGPPRPCRSSVRHIIHGPCPTQKLVRWQACKSLPISRDYSVDFIFTCLCIVCLTWTCCVDTCISCVRDRVLARRRRAVLVLILPARPTAIRIIPSCMKAAGTACLLGMFLCSDQTKLDHNQRRRDADADETQVEFSYQMPLIILASLTNSVLLSSDTAHHVYPECITWFTLSKRVLLSALHGLPCQSGFNITYRFIDQIISIQRASFTDAFWNKIKNLTRMKSTTRLS